MRIENKDTNDEILIELLKKHNTYFLSTIKTIGYSFLAFIKSADTYWKTAHIMVYLYLEINVHILI